MWWARRQLPTGQTLAIKRALVIFVIAGMALAQYQEEIYEPPQPFDFTYSSEDAEGTHSHSQQGDASGRITGEYTIRLADGRSRTVRYTADENGYRAEVITNELGTESKNSADVTVQSSALTGGEAAYETVASELRPVHVRF
ncbi:cuticle protein 10.9-like [Tropilaelaps mercedesae]|uniref:Cuticle protein 10.9-like n=1 Tax=Tropilaelaps mercedesae TaxID=418985 RepID=A0A1V9XJB6_9ACAR|nr:cuticle protein 10.9-like [Tropilaelaps mercedesae]